MDTRVERTPDIQGFVFWARARCLITRVVCKGAKALRLQKSRLHSGSQEVSIVFWEIIGENTPWLLVSWSA